MTDREPYDAPMLTKHQALLDITGATKLESDLKLLTENNQQLKVDKESTEASQKATTDNGVPKTADKTSEKSNDKAAEKTVEKTSDKNAVKDTKDAAGQ